MAAWPAADGGDLPQQALHHLGLHPQENIPALPGRLGGVPPGAPKLRRQLLHTVDALLELGYLDEAGLERWKQDLAREQKDMEEAVFG